jgi:hypothetical protein
MHKVAVKERLEHHLNSEEKKGSLAMLVFGFTIKLYVNIEVFNSATQCNLYCKQKDKIVNGPQVSLRNKKSNC